MIIWINGAFGAGKTTVANALSQRLKESYIYDPENAGQFIRQNSPSTLHFDDFQDHKEWRDINYMMLKYLDKEYNGMVIVPMTIIDRAYYDEIVLRLIDEGVEVRHFVLDAKKETLIRRLNQRSSDKDDEAWAKSMLDSCIESFNRNFSDDVISTEGLAIEDVVELLLQRSASG